MRPVRLDHGTTKYRNKPVRHDGAWFASQAELDRWLYLQAEQQAGRIVGLKRQQRFRLWVNDVKICEYVCDFSYAIYGTGALVVEDVKSPATAALPLFRVKKALMRACLGIDVQEVVP